MSIRGEYVDQLLFDAVLSLAETTKLNKITVMNVAARAGVARQTFYNHFSDINDLISRGPFNWVRSRSEGPFDRNGIREAYAFALEHKAFFSQLPAHSGQNNFREAFTKYVEEYAATKYLSESLTGEEALRRLLEVHMYAHAIVDSFLDWCATGLAWPLDLLVDVQMGALPEFVSAARHAAHDGGEGTDGEGTDGEGPEAERPAAEEVADVRAV